MAAVEPQRLLLGNGSGTTVVDLAPFSLEVTATTHRKPVQIRSEGDVVFVADRLGARECAMKARGAYRLSFSGGPLTTLFEECFGLVDDGQVGGGIAMSANGTVAFSQIVNGNGALYRGPALGPVSVLRSGTGTFYNTGALDLNDSERVMVQMEHSDGPLRRGILAFDTPEQDLASIDTAIEKLGIGLQPHVSMNASGMVAFSLDFDVTISIGGMMYSYVAGVYVATPTPFNTPKSLTLISNLSGDYCRFGAVEINDAGEVVFEAQIDGEVGCLTPSLLRSYDGLFTGPDPVADAVVRRGNPALGDHQFFDSVLLGETNNAGQSRSGPLTASRWSSRPRSGARTAPRQRAARAEASSLTVSSPTPPSAQWVRRDWLIRRLMNRTRIAPAIEATTPAG